MPNSRDSLPGVPRQPFDSSTEILQMVLQEVRDLRAYVNDAMREQRDQVSEMREELAEVKGTVVGIDVLQRQRIEHDKEQDERQKRLSLKVQAIREDLDEHKEADGKWQSEHSSLLTSLKGSVDQVLPLAKSHEEIVMQARGAIKATKIGYACVAALVGSGGILGGHMLTRDCSARASVTVAPAPTDAGVDASRD